MMELRTFGLTNQRVSALGFGGGPAGVPNYLMPWDSSASDTQAQVERAVRRALERGITYFDTAPSYGDGRSETNLGRTVAGLGIRDRIGVGTKMRLTAADLPDIRGATRGSLEASLRRLKIERINGHHLDRGATRGMSRHENHCGYTSINRKGQFLDQLLIRHNFVLSGRQNPVDAFQVEWMAEDDRFAPRTSNHKSYAACRGKR